MIKAEINENHIKAEINGEVSTILAEMHNFIESTLSDIANSTGDSKHHMLMLLTQNILKEWSAEK